MGLVVEQEGGGSVTGLAANKKVISCGADCTYVNTDPELTIELSAVPDTGARFVEWQGSEEVVGGCGTNPICSLAIPNGELTRIKAVFSHDLQTCGGRLAQGVHALFRKSRMNDTVLPCWAFCVGRTGQSLPRTRWRQTWTLPSPVYLARSLVLP